MSPPPLDRNALLGLLAVRIELLSPDVLAEAVRAWERDPGGALGQLLGALGLLQAEEMAHLNALVEDCLKRQAWETLVEEAPASGGGEPPRSPDSGPSRYRVLRPHAKGGLGEVFVALDEELQREVALKEIQARHADDATSRQRFLLEGEITGRLEHPGIVPVYGLGTHADGRPFYAMRFIKGDSLKKAIQHFHNAAPGAYATGLANPRRADLGKRALELRGLLGRFVAVCNAVAYAHSKGILHRDLKPDNVMLGNYGETLVVDWGLAKAIGRKDTPEEPAGSVELRPSRLGPDAVLTQAGSVLGTPAYMSPEQASGQHDELGPASDVYGLGAILYELLTGRAPFLKADPYLMLEAVCRGQFPRPREIAAEVPAALEAVCLKAMARRADDRYASAKELAEDIEHWLADEPVAAYPEPLRQRVARWRRRHPALVTGTAALVFSAVAALGIGGWLLSAEQTRTLQEQQGKLDEQQKRALAQVDALLNATPKAVPTILDGLGPYREQVRPRLVEVRRQAEPKDATEAARKLWQQHRSRAALALLPEDAEQLTFLKERLVAEEVEPEEALLLLRDQVALHGGKELAKELWTEVRRRGGKPEQRFRALVALARLDPKNPRWKEVGREVVGPLLAAEPLHAAVWSAGLRDVKEHLLAALAEAFRDREHAAERRLATSILSDYVGDDPQWLAGLLMDADDQQFVVLFPKLRAHGERGLAPLLAELDRQPARSWKDAPLDPSWKQPAAELVRKIEAAQGLLGERFALCQAMPLDEFLKVAESLRRCGYRPVRFRPYTAGKRVQVAAVWVRDGRAWDFAHDLTAEAVRERDRAQQKRQQRPVDVAGYLDNGRERYAVVWVQTDPKEDVRLYVGVSDRGHRAAWQPLRKDELQPLTLHTFTLANGDYRFSSVWRKPAPAGTASWSSNEQQHADQPALTDMVALDVSLTITLREVACEAVAWVSGSPWPGLAWRSQQPVLAHPTLRYAGTWQASATLEQADLQGLDPVAHLARCRELIAQGYRPAALSVVFSLPSPPLRGRGVGGEGVRAPLAPGGRGIGGEGVLSASVWHRPVIADEDKEHLAKRQANAGVALLRLGRPERVWPLLKHRPDPRVRSYLIHRLSPLGADPQTLWRRFEVEDNVTVRRALLLCLGEFGETELPVVQREKLLPRLFELYRNDPDAGLHGAAAWLLRQWGQRDKLKALDEQELARRDREKASPVPSGPGGTPRWHVNGQGQTMVLIPGPVEFWMGSPRTEAGREGEAEGRVEQRHYQRVGRSFALAAHEVTVEQFLRFRKGHEYNKTYARTPDCPMNVVTWFDAAAYCNWLSKQEGIPEDQWCYLPNEADAFAKRMKVRPNYLSLRGYRLPTEAEWEYACRAEAVTARYYGETDELLPSYAWYTKNSKDRGLLPVGSLKPNDLGLFDMLGNAVEWCQDPVFYYTPGTLRSPRQDIGYNGDIKDISDELSRLLRGGAFTVPPRVVRSVYRAGLRPSGRNDFAGFRPARTFP